MIVFGVVSILLGLGFVFAPEKLLSGFGLEQAPASVPYFLALLGNAYIACGFFFIVAARDPLKHIIWAQLGIAWSLLDAIGTLYFLIRGNVNLSQVGVVPILDIIFVAAFLISYPWRKAPGS